MNRKGFAPLIVVGIIALIALAGVGIWYFVAQKTSVAPPGGNGSVACTQEVKQCPDGSYVGRTGPNCEFAACPPVVATSSPTSTTGGRGAGAFCGGIATGAFPCDPGYSCKLDGTYPDAGGHCVKN